MPEKDDFTEKAAGLIAFLIMIGVLAGYILIFTWSSIKAPIPTAALYTMALCALGICFVMWTAKEKSGG